MTYIDKRYQYLLRDLKLYNGPVDGVQGPNTTKGVMRFQEMNGLKPDGVVGPRTKQEFEEQLSPIQDRQGEVMTEQTEVWSYRRWPRENTNDLIKFYGSVNSSQVRLEPPYKMYLAWDKGQPISGFSCHSKVADSLYKVLSVVKETYSEAEIKKHGFDMFGGCLNPRKIRGGSRWSTHAWGIAIDIDPARNRLKTPWKQAYLSRPECQDFVMAFKNEGWYSLGLEKNYDAMHFQACWR